MNPCPPATNTDENCSPKRRFQVAFASAVRMRCVRLSTVRLPCGLTLMNPSTPLPNGRNAALSWLTTSTPSVPSNESDDSASYATLRLPVKCLASCLLVRCMSSRTVPNDATPSGLPAPVQWPSPVGRDESRGVMQDASSGRSEEHTSELQSLAYLV